MRERVWALPLVGLLSVAGLGACGDDDDETATATTTEETEESEATKLDITAEDHRFTGVGGTIEGGVVEITLTNQGQKNHEAAFLQIGEKTTDEALEDLAPAFQGAPFPDAPKLAGGVTGIEPGRTATSTILLPAGTYALICALSDDARTRRRQRAAPPRRRRPGPGRRRPPGAERRPRQRRRARAKVRRLHRTSCSG